MHTHPFYLVLLIIGAVCFVAATLNAPVKFNLVALGLLAWVLVPLCTLAQN